MYSYIFFALFIVVIFSMIENLKGRQKISFFKLNIQILLFFIGAGAFLFFLDELGFKVMPLINIIRILGTLSLVNIFYIIANNKISKNLVYIEVLLIIIYSFMMFKGFSFMMIKNGSMTVHFDIFQKFQILFINLLMLGFMFYNVSKIYIHTDKQNLYSIKIRNWSFFLLLLVVSIILIGIGIFFLHKHYIIGFKPDTRPLYIIIYSILLVFVLFRPRFIDEADFSYSLNKLIPAQNSMNAQNFEFLFYTNHYYLQSEANLEDFALKLNCSKIEVLDYLKSQTTDSFTELLNRNRIKYFKDLLKSKKQDSFTIEALSEMSGFNNRQSMYNAFKKYEGCSPSEFIYNL